MERIFIEAEYLINSRPYLKQSDDPFDNVELTLNYILIPYNISLLPSTKAKLTVYQKGAGEYRNI